MAPLSQDRDDEAESEEDESEWEAENPSIHGYRYFMCAALKGHFDHYLIIRVARCITRRQYGGLSARWAKFVHLGTCPEVLSHVHHLTPMERVQFLYELFKKQ